MYVCSFTVDELEEKVQMTKSTISTKTIEEVSGRAEQLEELELVSMELEDEEVTLKVC